MKKNPILWTMFALSFVGFIDAAYLAVNAMVGAPVACYIFSGCDVVVQSAYSKIFGMPLSVVGILFYAAMIVLMTHYLQRKSRQSLALVIGLGLFGGLFSAYLLIAQAFIIEAWCFYCVISGTIGAINALLALCLLRLSFLRKQESRNGS